MLCRGRIFTKSAVPPTIEGLHGWCFPPLCAVTARAVRYYPEAAYAVLRLGLPSEVHSRRLRPAFPASAGLCIGGGAVLFFVFGL